MIKPQMLVAASLLLAAVLLPGCVGYNHTLFMTKSNVGLDLDTKPPTAEVNISRKEGVVAPTFEGGQTPPVMASFGGQAGGTVRKFFFGVDQTFAGGDAAVTMAKLYNAATPTEEGAARAYDSTLTLTRKPNANAGSPIRKFLFGLAEPGEVRPMIFGTDTQLGLKVGWTGTGGPYPDNVKIGFHRKEAALAPITMKVEDDQYKVRMPSFLATVSSDVTGGPSGDASSPDASTETKFIQYFATGDAADLLARQEAVRESMLGRLDPKQKLILDRDLVNEIVDYVTRGGTTIDQGRLEGLSKSAPGLVPSPAQWVAKFQAGTPDALRKDLRGINSPQVRSLHKAIQ